MPKNLTLSDSAYERLNKYRKDGKSFSDVVLELVSPQTAGDLLEAAEKRFAGKKFINQKRMKEVERGRGRRSNRPAGNK